MKNVNSCVENPNDNFVEKLKEIFSRRSEKNSKYSLRAFARDLQIEPSLLSKIMRGLYPLTEAMLQRIARRLGLSEEEIANLVQEFRLQNKALEEGKAEKANTFFPIAIDHLKYISESYHIDLLALIETVDFKNDIGWIANRLDLSEEKVKDAFDRLVRLGYIVLNEQKVTLGKPQYSTLGFPSTSDSLKQMQATSLEQAIKALFKVPLNERSQSTLTFAVDMKLIPKIIDEINSFRRKINKLASVEGKRPTEVYHLSLSLYPVTTRNNRR
ncbi:TIGR02147 family protein [Bdellovibrio sp. ArHS]|uniref:TIGR02147 family protein n=1 Tax=Bdellovibrio sp. ArHS TaxID=1569284 RepID=UPI0025B9FBDB|nr:TIGR02147 family protein [Bdellovibrio sp. ArHS]